MVEKTAWRGKGGGELEGRGVEGWSWTPKSRASLARTALVRASMSWEKVRVVPASASSLGKREGGAPVGGVEVDGVRDDEGLSAARERGLPTVEE